MTTTINNNNHSNRVIQELRGTYIYCRSISPDQLELIQKYVDAHTISKHNVKKVKLIGKITVSGLSAIYMTMANLVAQEKNQVNIIMSDELYCDTPKILKSFGCNTLEFDVTKPDSLLTIFENKLDPTKANVLFFESASNPNGDIFPFELLPKLRALSKTKLYVVVDNTWLTHVVLNPFQFLDVDIVVNSCSKYYSAGECVSGMIISNSVPFMQSLENLSKIMGYHVSVDYCKILLSKFDSIQNRIIEAHKNTVALTKELQSYGFISVRNSSDPKDSSNALAVKYYNKIIVDGTEQTIHPSVINVNLEKPIEVVKQLLALNNIITQTSFGSHHTKVCNFIKKISPQETQIRISVGYGPLDLKMFSFLKNLKNL